MAATNYWRNKYQDWRWRGQILTPPATNYFALLISTKGPRANSTAYALNDTFTLAANDGKLHLYKVTTAGTSAAAQSTLYPGVTAESITDGTMVAQEQTTALRAGTAQVEPSGGGYARASRVGSLANFAGTQASGSTAVSTGTNGTTSNNAAMTFAASAPTADWKFVWAVACYDASTAGNCTDWWPLNAAQSVVNGGSIPGFAIAALKIQFDQ
jgi:hypothetical protein